MCRAVLALYQATGEQDYLAQSEKWVDLLDVLYRDSERGGYFLTASDAADLIVRVRNGSDHATPSGNGMMVEVLASLYYLTGKPAYRGQAESQIGAFAGEAVRNAIPLASFLSGIDLLLNGVQIVIRIGVGTECLLDTVQDCCVPNRILSLLGTGEQSPKGHPAERKRNIANLATAYVCVGETCSMPITDPQVLRSLLARPPAQMLSGI